MLACSSHTDRGNSAPPRVHVPNSAVPLGCRDMQAQALVLLWRTRKFLPAAPTRCPFAAMADRRPSSGKRGRPLGAVEKQCERSAAALAEATEALRQVRARKPQKQQQKQQQEQQQQGCPCADCLNGRPPRSWHKKMTMVDEYVYNLHRDHASAQAAATDAQPATTAPPQQQQENLPKEQILTIVIDDDDVDASSRPMAHDVHADRCR